MLDIIVTDLSGETRELKANPGDILMELLRDNDFEEIEAVCGGICSCATCHIYIDSQWHDALPKKEDEESELISSLDANKPTSRLACQIVLNENMQSMKVAIAPMQD